MEDMKLELCRILLKTGALKFGAFKLTSGKLSPYYIDLRIIPSYPKALRRIIEFYELLAAEELKGEFDKIAGVPTSGIPFAAILAYRMDKPFIYLRKERKTMSLIEAARGYWSLGLPVVPLKGKKPLVEWAKWQTQPQTEQEFNGLPWAEADGFAIICGSKAKNGLFFGAIDFDVKNVD
ncbi:MAG: bifunctional DNA primase/polymerase, partial [Candidatus Bathyarchaeia archaeon]